VHTRSYGDFVGPSWVWPGLVCPYCHVWSAPAGGSGGRQPSYLATLTSRSHDEPRNRGVSSRMPGRWPRKMDYTGDSAAGDVVVVMAISWGHRVARSGRRELLVLAAPLRG
jgi:hypothetical protein